MKELTPVFSVTCINIDGLTDLTIGYAYDVFKTNDEFYLVRNNCGYLHHYFKTRFVTREQKLKRILNEQKNS